MLIDKIDPEDIMKSLSIEDNIEKMFQAGQGAGASGSFFFFSKDNRFVIKTMTKHEKLVLGEILDDYIDHLTLTENKSLIARIYGVFTIETNQYNSIDVYIMQNTVILNDNNNPTMKFDLKGSTAKREVFFSNKDKEWWLRE
jgi:1-phosphatidylinositol-4-phosphate 5-kinase